MIFGMNALLIAPVLQKLEGIKKVEDAVTKQGDMFASISNALGCARPDKFKASWDQRQLDLANGATNLPPLKQI